jgi:threonine/homoserine/homoserine lactone efflux protein
MDGSYPVLLSALAGLICGLTFSSVPGPINLTILNEGAQRGFRWAFLIGLGASVMDCTYCAISFTGFSALCHNNVIKATMQLFSFVFLLYLGFKFRNAQTLHVPTRLDSASEKIEARLEEKLHPHSAFMTGFVRVLGNLGVLLAWVVWSGFLVAHDWVAESFAGRAACVGGVFIGATLWFLILSYGISCGHGKFSEKTMLRLQHLSGNGLIIAGLCAGGNIIWHLAYHAHHKL